MNDWQDLINDTTKEVCRILTPDGAFFLNLSPVPLGSSKEIIPLPFLGYQIFKDNGLYLRNMIPSLTVAEIKNRCIPCVYWGTAIFVVVMKYSNLFFSFAFFLDRSHFAFGYELIISSEAAGFMKIICNGFTLI